MEPDCKGEVLVSGGSAIMSDMLEKSGQFRR